MRRLNELVALLCVPEPQRGIVKKLVQHAVKLALLHRCFRWAVGEFGDIDADDAQATAAATLFFLSRWLYLSESLGPKTVYDPIKPNVMPTKSSS